MAKKRVEKKIPISIGYDAGKGGGLKAKYDSAQTTYNDMNHWKNADNLSPIDATSKPIRNTLVKRARYETENNCYAKGLVMSVAEAIVGTGIRLHIVSGNEKLDQLLPKKFAKWSKAIGLPEKLRMGVAGEITDGEAFVAFQYNPKLKTDSKLDLVLIETERVSDTYDARRTLVNPSINYVDGIKYDDFGNVEYYNVLKSHPSNFSSLDNMDSVQIDASQMRQLFRTDRIGQKRGVPQITPALPLFAQLRRYTLAVLDTAETSANFSGVVYTDVPADGEAVAVTPMESIELQKRMLLTLPEGWKIGQMKAEQPTTMYGDFKNEILNEASRCILVPRNIARGDSSDYNYASGRLDKQQFEKGIEIRREKLESILLEDMINLWLDEEQIVTPKLRGARMREDFEFEIFWDGEFHVDPTKEAQAQNQRLLNKTTTLKRECAKEGLDYRSVIKQSGLEKKLLDDEDLVIGEVIPQNTMPNEPKPTKNKGKSNAKATKK